jgi:DHA1 family tetracycline resistance protein-like MFS transporter
VWVQSLPILLLSRLVIGISAGGGAVASAAIADLSLASEKPKNFGLLNMAWGLGFTVGPYFGGKLSGSGVLGWKGYDKPFLFAGVLMALNLVFLLFFFKETHIVRKGAKLSWVLGVRHLKKAFHIPGMRLLFFSIFLFALGWSFYWEFIPVTWISRYHLNVSEIGNFYAYGAFFYALGSGVLIRPVAKWLRPRKLLLGALFCSGLYMFAMLFLPSSCWLWGYLPLQQIFIAFLFPTATALISNSVAEDSQGEMLGILQSVQECAFGLAPLLSGVFFGLSHAMPIVVGGGAMLLAGLTLISKKTSTPA